MAKDIIARLRFEGTVEAVSALHVGGLAGDVDADMALAEDGQGRLLLPGTGLAGSLREWTRRRFGDKIANDLWGSPTQESVDGASRIIISDALVKLPPGATVEIRDGIGMDRIWGVAANRLKFTRAVMPAGSTFTLRLLIEVAGTEVGDRHWLGAVVDALQRGELTIGAAQTRGLGRVRLTEWRLTREDLSGLDGLLRSLSGEDVVLGRQDLGQCIFDTKWPCIDIYIDWAPEGTVMMKSGSDGLAVDMLPQSARRKDGVALLLQGGSIKGALRNAAERIIRTVRPETRSNSQDEDFLSQIQVPLVMEVFGSARPRADANVRGGKGALSVSDTWSRRIVPPRQWQVLWEAADDTALQSALQAFGSDLGFAMHVAIDRWNGGAAESMLYNVLEPIRWSWEPLMLRLDLTRLPTASRIPALTLVLLLLRDLKEGRIPVGFGVNRGMGGIRVNDIRIRGSDLDGAWLALVGEHSLADLQAWWKSNAGKEWKEWLGHPLVAR